MADGETTSAEVMSNNRTVEEGTPTTIASVTPLSVLSISTTRNGQSVCKPTCKVNRLMLNQDVNWSSEIRTMHEHAEKMIDDYGHDMEKMEMLLDIMWNAVNSDEDLMLPEHNDFDWPKELPAFIDSINRVVEIRVNESMDEIKGLLKNLAEGVEAAIFYCIVVVLTFEKKERKIRFLEILLKKNLSKDIAATVLNEEFCSKLTTIEEDLRASDGHLLTGTQKEMLTNFLERICDVLAVNIYFRVDQMIDESADGPCKFEFTVASAKLLMSPHDTRAGDNKVVTYQMDTFLKRDPGVHELFRQSVSAQHKRMLQERASETKQMETDEEA